MKMKYDDPRNCELCSIGFYPKKDGKKCKKVQEENLVENCFEYDSS